MKSKRFAAVDRNRCVSCGACLKECPRDAIEIVRGCYARISADVCIGCGKCAAVCPADSITVQERENRDE